MDNSKTQIKVTVTRDSDTLEPAGESRCTSHRSSSTSKITHQKCEVAAPQKNLSRSLSNNVKRSTACIDHSFTTEQIIECFYAPQYTDSHKGVKMLCSRVNVITRNLNRRSNPPHALSVENIYGRQKTPSTNTILEHIGLVVNDGASSNVSKMDTFEPIPSKMNYYKRNIASYSAKRNVRKMSSGADSINRKWRPPNSSNNHAFNNGTNEYRNYKKSIDKMIEGIVGPIPNKTNREITQTELKYWSKRHMLFSKFDDGILLDDESFYSVCSEALSYHIAKRCANKVVIDPFCGAGGNVIQLAFTCEKVIAVDIDPVKIAFAKRNAKIYGVSHKIEFIVGDFFQLAPTLKADVLFMSPPWGGPDYSAHSFSLESMCSDHFGGGFSIFNLAKKVAPNIAFHMPKTTNIQDCLWLARSFGKVEVQQNIIDHRLDSITAFYGEDFVNVTDNDY